MKDRRKRFRVIYGQRAPYQSRIAWRFRQISVLRLLPSLLTLLAMYFGFTSLYLAMNGKFEIVLWLICAAAGLDALDGRVARLTRSDSRFGAELDSLADFLNFGIAPAFTMWIWGLKDLGNFGWVLAFFFAICCALRLARFNAAFDQEGVSDKRFFAGVPAPAGGLLIFTPMVLSFLGLESKAVSLALLVVFVIGTGLLMVSNLPTYSIKNARLGLPRRKFTLTLLVLVVTGVMIFNFPFHALIMLGAGYLILIPVAGFHARRRSAP